MRDLTSRKLRVEHLAKLSEHFQHMIERGYTVEEILNAVSAGTGAQIEIRPAKRKTMYFLRKPLR